MPQPPAGTLQCFPSTSSDPNIRGLFESDGVNWIHLRDIPREQCPGYRPHLHALAVKVAASYVANHSLPAGELAGLVTDIHHALATSMQAAPPPQEPPKPAVPIRKSVTPEAIFSLEDGKPYKHLSRHLSARGLTAEGYRAKWGLPSDYPMVAPNYAKRRSELASQLGLGRSKAPDVAVAAAPKGRRRKKPD